MELTKRIILEKNGDFINKMNSNNTRNTLIIEQKENFILVEEKNTTSKILIKNILYLSYEDSVVTIHFVNDREIINLSRTLKSFEQELLPYGFIRVCRNFMIDISKVICINRKKYKLTILKNKNIPISRRKMTELRQLMSNFKNRLSANNDHSSN